MGIKRGNGEKVGNMSKYVTIFPNFGQGRKVRGRGIPDLPTTPKPEIQYVPDCDAYHFFLHSLKFDNNSAKYIQNSLEIQALAQRLFYSDRLPRLQLFPTFYQACVLC